VRNNYSKSSVKKASILRRRWRLVLIGLLVLLIFSAGFLVFIRSIIDGDRIAHSVLANVEAEIHKEVTYAASSLSWISLTRCRVTIRDIVCRDQAGSPPLFRIPSTVLDVSLIPILWGTASFDRAVISTPVFFLTSSSETKPDKRVLTSPDPVSRLSFMRPRVGSLLIEGGQVVLGKHGELTTATETQVRNINLMARDIRSGWVETARATADVIAGTQSGTVEVTANSLSNPFVAGSTGSLEMKVSKAPMATVQNLLAYFGIESPFPTGTVDLKATMQGGRDRTQITGTASINQAVLLPVGVFHRQTVLPHAALKYLIEFSPTNIQMHIKELSLPGARVVAKIGVEGIETRDPRLSVDLSKASLELEDLFPFIPVKLMTQEDREKFLESRLKGKILITGGSWTGKLSELVGLDKSVRRLAINIVLDGVSGFIPSVRLTLSEGFGHIRLERSELVMKKINLLVGEAIVSVKGRVWDLTSVPQLDLSVMVKGKTEGFRGLWESKVLAERLTTRLGPIKELKGTIDASVALKGSTSQPELNGQAQFKGVGWRFTKLPLPLSRFEGSLDFRGSVYSVASVKGFVGQSSLAMDGNVSDDGLDLSAQLNLVATDLKRLKWMPLHAEFTGKIPLGVKLGGTWSKLTFESSMDLRRIGLRLGAGIGKEPGIPLAITASGIRSAKGVTTVTSRISLGKTFLHVHGERNENGLISASVNLPRRGLLTDSLMNIVDPAFQLRPGGRIEGRVAIRMGPRLPSDLRMNVDLKCANLSMRIPRIKGPLVGLTGSFLSRGQSVNAVMREGKIGRSQFTGKCSIEGFVSPKVDFTLRFPFFDATDFEAPNGKRSEGSWRKRDRSSPVLAFLARSQVRGLVEVPKGRVFERPFSDLRIGFEGAGGIVKIPKWEMNMAGGRVEGSGFFDVRSGALDLSRVDFRGDGLLMERVLTAGGQESVLEGRTKASGWMAWETGPAGKDEGSSRQGFFQVEISDGRVRRFEILSKIFSLINLGSFARGRLPDVMSSGLPFQKLTWRTEVVNNKWIFKDMRLASDTATIEASGMYVSDQKRMNFKVQVAPLVGVDKIVSTVAKKLLNRDVKTLTTTFKVRGLYASPDVRLIPLETLKSSGD
jgi:hypothetical protein